ncbi:MAG TPA: hypothetical protein VMU51_05000 [Mycobacteriales bacterium]|nr:hypothetical protein [Mycobacteriales bacterium]
MDLWWNAWASATTPTLTPAVVLARRSTQNEASNSQADLIARLNRSPQVTTIKGGSLEEVQAFIAAALLQLAASGEDVLKARAAFVDDVVTYRALLAQSRPLVLIPTTQQTRAEPLPASHHHIVVPLVQAASADIELPPIDPAEVADALKGSGIDDQRADKLGRLARRSLLALRRDLANKPELHQPPWAEQPAARPTRGVLLAGTWNEGREGDKDALASLGGSTYDDLREAATRLAVMADPLVGRVDAVWALVSAYDAWSQLAAQVQPDDLARLGPIVQNVLCEIDPALELPADKHWRASLEGKVRVYSSELRRGIASTLALLGVHGERVEAGSGTNGANWASSQVRQILDAANGDINCSLWISLADILPLLAEASPDAFLTEVEKGLDGDRPLLAGLFDAESVGGLFGGRSPHTGLLWALESAIWSSAHFGRAVEVLARLAEIDPGGKMSNRPAATLTAVFNPWHPDNSVDVNRRFAVVDGLRTRHPAVAWQLMLTMLPETHGIHMPIHEPVFRGWKPTKLKVTNVEYFKTITEVVARMVEDSGRDAQRRVVLIQHMSNLPPVDRAVVLEVLQEHVDGSFSEEDRARIWESLRSLIAKHREYADSVWALPEEELAKIDEVQSMFKPAGVMEQHLWLFQDYMPPLPEDSIRTDHTAYQAALDRRREGAVADIDAKGGYDHLSQLAREATQPWWVGVAIADATGDKYEDRLLALLGSSDSIEAGVGFSYAARRFVQGGWPWLEAALERMSDLSSMHQALLLLSTADYPRAWQRADQLGQEVAGEFWKKFQPYGLGPGFAYVAHAVGRLMAVGRNAVALALVELYARRDAADIELLVDPAASALESLIVADDPEIGGLRQYSFNQLFDLFYDYEATLGWERIARLEWAYLPALGYDANPRMPGRLLARDPNFFVEMVSTVFRPASTEEEPPVAPADEGRVLNAYRLLDDWSPSPGVQEDGSVDADMLAAWISQAIRGLESADRLAIGSEKIGNVLARIPAEPDGAWPSLAVRNLLESLHSTSIDTGFYVAILDRRGVTTRSPESGGGQERSLAAKYRSDADKYADGWPRTAAILRSLAESYEHDSRREDHSAERSRRGQD